MFKAMGESWQVWALASAVFAALTAIFAKLGVQAIDSNLATLLRVLILLPLVGAIVAATGAWRGGGALSAQTWGMLALSGLATGASWLCYFRALKLGQASQVAPLDKLSVVFVALLGVSVLGEKLTVKGWAGVAAMALGAVLLAF